MDRMKKHFPEDYRFFPNTWILPADYALLQNYAKDMKSKKKSKTFIFKPANGAQGHGSVKDCLSSYIDHESIVLFISPMFDQRLYVM